MLGRSSRVGKCPIGVFPAHPLNYGSAGHTESKKAMENHEKDQVVKAVNNAIEDALGELQHILDKYDIVIRMGEITDISQFVLKILESKIK